MLLAKEEDGYALIIVLWSIVILSIIFSYLLDDFFLDSYLVEAYSQQQKLKETALSVYNIGLNTLLNDKTIYDTGRDDWINEFKGDINDIKYTMNIEDIGSKINLNYDNLDILNELDDWDGDVDEIRTCLEEDILPDILFLKGVLDDQNYQVLSDYTSIYGNYNVNHDSPQKINKILKFLELDFVDSNLLADSLTNYREEEGEISNFDELSLIWNHLGISVFEDMKPYLNLEGRININLVNEDILKAIFKFYGLDSNLVESVMAFRKEKELKNLDDLSFLINAEDFEELKNFFTTYSTFLELDIYVELAGIKGYTIKSVVKRSFQEDMWVIDVLSWSEKEVFLEVIDNGDEKI